MHITTPEEKEAFRALSQPPVVEYVNEQLGKEFVDSVLAQVAEAEKVIYGKQNALPGRWSIPVIKFGMVFGPETNISGEENSAKTGA